MVIRRLIHAFFELYRPKSNQLFIAPLLAAGLISGGGQILGGILQRFKSKNLKQSNYISPGLKEAETEAKLLSNASTAPGQQAEEEMARQNTSQFISNASKVSGSANELLNYTGAATGNQNRAMRDIARRTLLWKDQQRASRNAIRMRIGAQQDENRRQFQAAKSALLGASNQNIFRGITDIGTGVALNSLYGGGKMGPGFNSDYGNIQ